MPVVETVTSSIILAFLQKHRKYLISGAPIMSSAVVKNLFKDVAEVALRRYPTEAAARESLDAFRNALHESTTPVESVLKRMFGRATVRRVESETGEEVFKIFVRSGRQRAEDALAPAMRALRSGDLDSVARSFELASSELGSKAFRKAYTTYARSIFPDVRVAEQAAAARRALPSTLSSVSRDLRPETANQLFAAIRRDKELDKIVTRLSEHVKKNGGKRFRYVSTFFVLTGVAGTSAAVATALHEQAKRSSGCWRVYLDPVTRQLRSCKIARASCINRDANDANLCDRTPLSFSADMCRGATKDECVGCDSTALPGSKQYIAPSQYLEPNDMYVCRPVASVGEMLGQMIADMPELARDVVGDVANTVFKLWDGVKYFALAAVVIVVILAGVYAFVNLKSKLSQYDLMTVWPAVSKNVITS